MYLSVVAGSFPHPGCLGVSSSSIVATQLVSYICPLSTDCISSNIAKSVKELECSSNYQTLKGTGLIALNLVSPWLSSRQYRPCAFSVVISSLSVSCVCGLVLLCVWDVKGYGEAAQFVLATPSTTINVCVL